MDGKKPKKGIGCEPVEGAKVRIYFTDDGKPTAQIDMPAIQIGAVAGALLVAAKQSSRLAEKNPTEVEKDKSLRDQTALIPSGIRLAANPPPEPYALVIESGEAQLPVAISEKWLSALGHALIAASASRDSKQ